MFSEGGLANVLFLSFDNVPVIFPEAELVFGRFRFCILGVEVVMDEIGLAGRFKSSFIGGGTAECPLKSCVLAELVRKLSVAFALGCCEECDELPTGENMPETE